MVAKVAGVAMAAEAAGWALAEAEEHTVGIVHSQPCHSTIFRSPGTTRRNRASRPRRLQRSRVATIGSA